jgi:hypothetical protein
VSLRERLARQSIVVAPGVFDAFSALLAAAVAGRMLDFEQLNALIGTPQMLELGKPYDGGEK